MAIEAIYGRQSIDKKDSVSIETQIDMCKTYLTKNEHEVYIDKGWSGKNTNRPRMNDLINDIKNDKISRVIAYRLDRISRNIVDFGNLLTLFNEHNVEFVSATENFDTSSPMGRAMVYIVMVFAQLERETIATRIIDNYKFRCTTGKFFMGGGIPYGYISEKTIIDDKKASIIVPNENATILVEIFDKFLSGFSFYQIVHELNGRGLKTSLGKPWNPNGIKRILQNITPCVADEQLYEYLTAYGYNVTNSKEDFDGQHGMCLFMKNKDKHNATPISDQIVVVGIHKPIISSNVFIKTQMLLSNEIKQNKRSNQSFLAGLVKCGECGYSFGLKSTIRKNKKYAYYYCRSRHSRGICDNDIYINADEFEKEILEYCIKYLKKILTKINKKEELKKDKINSDDRILILEQQISNLVDNIGKGNSVVDDILTSKITEIKSQINKIKQETQIEFYSTNLSEETNDIYTNLLNFQDLNIEEKVVNIRKVVKCITITKDKKINIDPLF